MPPCAPRGADYHEGGMFRQKRAVPPEEAQAARARLREVLSRFLRTPGLRNEIRRATVFKAVFFALQIVLCVLLGRIYFYGVEPFFAHKDPWLPFFLPERTRCLLRSITSADAVDRGGASGALGYLEKAERLGRSPYTWNVRAALVSKKLERLDLVNVDRDLRKAVVEELRGALREGARLDGGNFFWPLAEACVTAREGEPGEAVDNLLRDCRDAHFFRIPEPEESYRDLLLAADRVLLWGSKTMFGGTNDLFAVASLRADQGKPACARLLGRIAGAAVEDFVETHDVFRRVYLAWNAIHLARQFALLAARSPGAFPADAAQLAKARALSLGALRRSLLSMDFLFSLDSVVLALACGFPLVSLIGVLLFSLGPFAFAFVQPRVSLLLLRGRLVTLRYAAAAAGLTLAVGASFVAIAVGYFLLLVVAVAIGLACVSFGRRVHELFPPLGRDAKKAGKGPWHGEFIRVPPIARTVVDWGAILFLPAFLLIGAYFFVRGDLTAERAQQLLFTPQKAERTRLAALWDAFDARYGALCSSIAGEADAARIRAAAGNAGLVIPDDLSPQARTEFDRRCTELSEDHGK
jgi:hypothetical protein